MICINCVTPTPLKKFVAEHGRFDKCGCCEEQGVAVEDKLLFDFILERIDENLATNGDLSMFEEVTLYDCGADNIVTATIDVVLAEWFELGDECYLPALEAYLPESYTKDDRGFDRHYYRDDGELERNYYEEQWDVFVTGILHAHRFFNPNAAKFLARVFGFLSAPDGSPKPEVVRTLERGTELFRARTVDSQAAAKTIVDDPASQLGPTPKEKSGSQRMTPAGIPALYCALERKTCLSEIRCITGDRVVSGAMTPTTQLRLLDLTKLALVEPPDLTLFDEGYLDALHLRKFVGSLVKKMSRPKGRNDELSYVSTQVVFEYLRLAFGEYVAGLVFPSVQTGEVGTNVVLFPEACVISASHFAPWPAGSEAFKAVDDAEAFAAAEAPASGAKVKGGAEPKRSVKLNAFASDDKIAFMEGSLMFHKVKAIETQASDYSHVSELFMSDLMRKQLNFRD